MTDQVINIETVKSSEISNVSSVDMLPARMLNEFNYCQRLFYLEWIQGQWSDNAETIEGRLTHKVVDKKSGQLPESTAIDISEKRKVTSVTLSSQNFKIIAKMDLIEIKDGVVVPIDYKKGGPSENGPWESDKIQVCAQGLVLEDNGYICTEGYIYYAKTNQRILVPFDESLRGVTVKAVEEAFTVASSLVPPSPLINSNKCPSCSLVGICLPDEITFLNTQTTEEVRRLVPARDDAFPLYVLTQGATIGVSSDRITVKIPTGEKISRRIIDVSQISIYGNVGISAQAIRAVSDREIPIFHHSYGGWLVAITSGLPSKNVELRVKQYSSAAELNKSLPIARSLIACKISNQRTLQRRNNSQISRGVLSELSRLRKLASTVESNQQLLGIEGLAAKLYFQNFAGMLKPSVSFDFNKRTRRPPTDPINALLSFCYTLLVKDVVKALIIVGLDPYRGLFHQMRSTRPALALDLAEEFRPLIADSVTLSVVNNRIISNDDFVYAGPACSLKDSPKKNLIATYERRMESLVIHPTFGYKVSYRRVIEIQARLLARTIEGELNNYIGFTTR